MINDSAVVATGIDKNELESVFAELMGYPPPIFVSIVTVDELTYTDKQQGEKPPIPFTAWAFSNPENLNIDEWYQKYGYYPSIWGQATPGVLAENQPQSKTMIANTHAQFRITQNMGTLQLVFVPTQDHMLLFEVRGDPTPDNIGNQILSTIQF